MSTFRAICFHIYQNISVLTTVLIFPFLFVHIPTWHCISLGNCLFFRSTRGWPINLCFYQPIRRPFTNHVTQWLANHKSRFRWMPINQCMLLLTCERKENENGLKIKKRLLICAKHVFIFPCIYTEHFGLDEYLHSPLSVFRLPGFESRPGHVRKLPVTWS